MTFPHAKRDAGDCTLGRMRRDAVWVLLLLGLLLVCGWLLFAGPRPLTCLAGPQVADHCTVDPTLLPSPPAQSRMPGSALATG